MNMKEIEAAAQAVQLPKIATSRTSNSRLSFNIVNSPRNGKRLRLSMGLTSAVNIKGNADMLPLEDKGLLMVAEKLPFDSACTVSLKDDSRSSAKICYNTDMVLLLTNMFNLDFTDHVSMSFDNITLDKLSDGTDVALIPIFDKYAAEGGALDQEQGQ